MSATTIERLLGSVVMESNLLPFLRLSGWEQVDLRNRRWIVMKGARDARGRPIEIVFPRDPSVGQAQDYVAKTVELLTALGDEPMQFVLQRIINYDRDLVYVRNVDTDRDDAMPLSSAVNQVTNLKRAVEFAASSEDVAKPHFTQPTYRAKQVLRSFLFGHTFAGSFGFTIEAPALPDPTAWQMRLPIGEDQLPAPIDVPVGRRVVERIARGLASAKQAQEHQSGHILLGQYASGLNSNMCSALAAISRGTDTAVEFRVAWSPKIAVGDELRQAGPVQLTKDSHPLLEDAAKKLRLLEPEWVTVVGNVRALSASDNPQSVGSRRAVVIRGIVVEGSDPTGAKRALDFVVELDPPDFAKASDMLLTWRTVRVNGTLVRSGNAWRLSHPRGFGFVNEDLPSAP